MRASKSLLLTLLVICLTISVSNDGKTSDIPEIIDDTAILAADSSVVSSIHFSMDSCSAWILAGTRLDYSEFTATQDLDSICSDISVLNGHLYRVNPTVNFHSCTPGINDTPAMCVSSDDSCTYDAGNEKSIKIDVVVTPGPSGLASLSNMTFYERAPEMFVFLDGPTGLNNYATKYAIRVLREGSVVFQDEDIPTNLEWTYQTIDFGLSAGLTVDTTTIFTIEMLAYCLIDNGESTTAWDIDELTINSVCFNDPLDGGELTTTDGKTEVYICSQDGVSDAFDVILTGNSGTAGQWLITDANDIIIETDSIPPFDFEGSLTGVCKVWHLSSEGPVLGVEVGNSITSIYGCIAFSNPIIVNKTTTFGGVLMTTSGETSLNLCEEYGSTVTVDVITSGATGSNSAWLVTDQFGNILDVPAGVPFVLTNISDGICQLWHVSYDGVLNGLEIGNNASELEGCYALSNTITVNKSSIDGGTLTSGSGSTDVVLCIEYGIPQDVNFILSGNGGTESEWVITDANLKIIEIPDSIPITFDDNGLSHCIVWHISHDGSLSGLDIGNNLADLKGCLGLTNGVTIHKNASSIGQITLLSGAVDTTLCEGDGLSDLVYVSNTTPAGSSSAWLITDENGTILELPSGPPFDFSNSSLNNLFIWFVAYDNISGLTIGSNTSDLTGCYGISNSINIHRANASGGYITVGGEVYIQICEDDQQSNILEVDQINQLGTNTNWLITDASGIIVSLPAGSSINMDLLPSGSYAIYNVMYNGSLTGLEIGNDITALGGYCISISNSITVVKEVAIAGTISSPLGDSIELCVSGSIDPSIEINISGSESDFSSILILDANGKIIGIESGSPITPDLSYDECFIRHLAYGTSFAGLALDQNIADFSGCYELSNAIRVSKSAVNGGYLTSGGEVFVNICSIIGEESMLGLELIMSSGDNELLVLTDENGEIIDFLPGLMVNLEPYPSGTYYIYNISYNGTIFNDTIGGNINDLTAECLDMSNPLEILKKAIDGGEISTFFGTDIVFCESQDSISLSELEISVFNPYGTHTALIITDETGLIIDLPAGPPLDLTNLTINPCFVWHISYEVGITGKVVGNHITDIEGCFDLSNYIRISKVTVDGGTIENNGSTQVDICVGNGSSGLVAPTVTGNIGTASVWAMLDGNGLIVELSASSLFDFSSSVAGTYTIVHVSYEDISGLELGENINDLSGCFSISNTIEVIVKEVVASTITFNDGSDRISACIGDGENDFIRVVTSIPGVGEDSLLILTDIDGNIVSTPAFSTINFENEEEGTCLIWQVHFNGILEGTGTGGHISDLEGCYQISNSIMVVKEEIIGSEISLEDGTDEINLCIGTGLTHLINVIEVVPGNGSTSWIITDENGSILESPVTLPFDFSDAPAGVCYIYQVNYLGILTGLEIGESINFLDGCHILSNRIKVVREEIAEPELTYENGKVEKTICISDAEIDLVSFNVNNTEGDGYYVVTDDAGVIIGIHENDPLDFSSAAAGVCHIYFINAHGAVTGLAEGENISDLFGCFKISNQLILNRLEFISEASSSSLCFDFNDCNAIIISGDNMDYSEFVADVTNEASCSQFSVVGDHLYRLNPTVNKHSCTPGVNGTEAICVTAHTDCDFIPDSDLALRFDILVEPGSNYFANISSLSFYERAPKEFVWIDGVTGTNNYPLRFGLRILKDGNEIFRQEDIPTSLNYTLQEFDFSIIDAFTVYEATTFSFELLSYCPIGSNGLEEIWDLDDIKIHSNCESQLTGGVLTSLIGLNSDEVCVDDGFEDNLEVINYASQGPNLAWIVTDTNGVILSLPAGPPFDFEGTGSGTIQLWRISYVNGLTGLTVGENTADLEGCYELSNPLTIEKKTGIDCPECLAEGGSITLKTGETETTICADDGTDNNVSFILTGNNGSESAWVLTDEDGFIIDVMSGAAYNFEGMSQGIYYVWHIAYEGMLQNMNGGNLINNIAGCYDLSNPITVNVETIADGGCASVTNPDDDIYMLSPNPVEYELAIDVLEDIEDNEFSFTIFNSLGKKLKSGNMKAQRTTVDVSDLATGIYIVRVTKNRKRFVESFMKI